MPSICNGFIERAAATPHSVAVSSVNHKMTYRELSLASGALARTLRAAGARQGRCVAVALPRGPKLVAALVAIAATGAAYVPLDPRHASRRTKFMLEKAQCALAVFDSTEKDVWEFPDHVLPIDVGGISEAPVQGLEVGDLAETTAADPLYVMFTSGSTGTPKGVTISHDAVSQLIEAVNYDLVITPGLKWSMCHSAAFDFSTWEIWGCLLTGGALHIASPEQVADPERLAEFIATEQIEILSQTPSSFRRIANERLLHTAARSGNLREIVFGGEALPSDVVRAWTAENGFENPRLVNMYGITETTVHSTVKIIDVDSLDAPNCPIGTALRGRTVAVCDEHGDVLPPKVIGEFLVGGTGLAIGYIDEPELTSERFITRDTPDGRQRFYRSGDLGFMDERGDLHYTGRVDRQVKIRGHRISVEEVEAAVRALELVEDAVVVPIRRPHEAHEVLVAYVTLADGKSINTNEAITELRSNLPYYMIPSRLLTIDAIPITSNGKLDTTGLPAPWIDAGSLAGPVQVRAPATGSLLDTVRAAFSDVLAIEYHLVSTSSDFFALGGDSLLALRLFDVVPQLRERLSIAALFQAATPEALAAAWHEKAAANSKIPQIAAAPEGRIELTKAQESLLFDWSISKAELYQDAVLVRTMLAGDLADVEANIRTVIESHPAAHLRIDLDAPGKEVEFRNLASAHIIASDDSDLSVDEGKQSARRWIARSRAVPFLLADESLFRARVAQLSDGSFTVALIVHHVFCDGWSVKTLIRDLIDLCQGRTSSSALEARFENHLDVLRNLPQLEQRDISRLKADDRPAELLIPRAVTEMHSRLIRSRETERQRLVVDIDARLAARVKSFAHDAKLPLKSVYVAAHLTAMGNSEDDDLASCISVSGRPVLPEADTCAGYFVRPRLIRVPNWTDRSNVEFARSVFAAEVELMRTMHAPLSEQIQSRGTLDLPTMFNYVDFHVLRETSDMILDLEHSDDNTFLLNVDLNLNSASAEPYTPSLIVYGALDSASLAAIAGDHLAALARLAGSRATGGASRHA